MSNVNDEGKKQKSDSQKVYLCIAKRKPQTKSLRFTKLTRHSMSVYVNESKTIRSNISYYS